MKYSLKKLLSNTNNSIDYDVLFFCKEIDSKYLLEVANKKYLLNYDYDLIDFFKCANRPPTKNDHEKFKRIWIWGCDNEAALDELKRKIRDMFDL
jgi:hypothetical protein